MYKTFLVKPGYFPLFQSMRFLKVTFDIQFFSHIESGNNDHNKTRKIPKINNDRPSFYEASKCQK